MCIRDRDKGRDALRRINKVHQELEKICLAEFSDEEKIQLRTLLTRVSQNTVSYTHLVTYTGSEQSVSGFTSDAPASVTVALKSESKAEAKGTNTGTLSLIHI